MDVSNDGKNIYTCLFYFPGLIYAFAVMSTSKSNIQENELLRNFS